MANTITVQNVVNWAQLFVRLLPVSGVGGVANEPALSIANQVQQTLLAPPFGWRWNRANTTFSTVAGTQDASQAVANLGWIERAALQSGSTDQPELVVKPVLPASATQGRPTHISSLLDNGTNVTFRCFPTPDAVYTVNIEYQQQAPLITALTGSWVVPDYLSYLYRQGFLALLLLYANDPRANTEYQKFIEQAMLASTGTNPAFNPVVAERMDGSSGLMLAAPSRRGEIPNV